jgi:integrase
MDFRQLVLMSRDQEATSVQPNSRRVYDAYMKSYEKKMMKMECEAYPVTEDKMRGFIMYIKSHQNKPACLNTIRLHVAAFADHLAHQDRPDITKNPRFKRFMRSIRLEMGESPPNARDPIGRAILTQVAEYVVQIDDPNRTVTFSMMTLMYYGFLRFSEATSLEHTDVVEEMDGITLHIRHSKTDPYGNGAICFIHSVDTPYCACKWLERARPLTGSSGRVFAISGQAFNRQLRELLTAAGVPNVKKFSSHSMRRGGAQEAARMGIEDNVIQRHGRWKSTVFMLYTVLERREAGMMITSRI